MALISWILIMLHYRGGGLTWRSLHKAALVICFIPERGRGWTFFRWREWERRSAVKWYENRKERIEAVCLKPVSFHSVLLPVLFSGPCCGQCHCVCVEFVLNWAHCWPVESEEREARGEELSDTLSAGLPSRSGFPPFFLQSCWTRQVEYEWLSLWCDLARKSNDWEELCWHYISYICLREFILWCETWVYGPAQFVFFYICYDPNFYFYRCKW